MKTLKIYLFFTVGILLVFAVKVNARLNVSNAAHKNNIFEQWKELDKNAGKLVGSAIKMILPHLLDSSTKINISSECMKQSMHLISGIRRLKLWAFSFIDSSAKMVDGMLGGTVSFPGVYEECVNIKAPSKDPEKPMYYGQYCKVNVLPPLPPKRKRYKFDEPIEDLNNFTGSEVINLLVKKSGTLYSFPYGLGLCVPSGCSANDIDQVVKFLAKEANLMTWVNSCEVKKKPYYSEGIILAIVLFYYMIGLVLLSTGYEWYLLKNERKNKNIWIRIFLCFSVITNIKRLFSTKTSSKSLKSLHGIKFLSITMVVLGHSYFYPFFILHAYQLLFETRKLMAEPMSFIILNSHVVVDTFFCLAGLLVCYVTMKSVKIDNKKMNIKYFIFHRLWRLAPVYYFVMIMSLPISLMGSGPYFNEAMKISVSNCRKYFWRNMLFINNFFPLDEICLMHTWYVACDFQLYLCTLLVLLPLIRSQKIGIAINILIIVVSVLYTGIMTYVYELPGGADLQYTDKELIDETYLKTYTNPLTHASSYFIGVLVGYILVIKPDIKIPQKYQILGWIVAVVFASYSFFYNSLKEYYHLSQVELAVYGGLYRTTWALAVAWMTFCCTTGRGGFINTFLSWTPWVPLAKLTFLMYLIQPTLQTMYTGVFKSTHEYKHYELIITYFGQIIMSGLLAIGCNLLIESPLMAIEKVLLGSPKQKSEMVVTGTNRELPVNGFSKTTQDQIKEMVDFKETKNDYCMDNKGYDEV